MGIIEFLILTEEWPQYAKSIGLKNPWVLERQQVRPVYYNNNSYFKFEKNPNAPDPPSFEDKLNYDLEENKFLIRRLIEEGDPDAAFEVRGRYEENKEKLLEYFYSLNLCGKNGQCNLFCKNYNNCIVISN